MDDGAEEEPAAEEDAAGPGVVGLDEAAEVVLGCAGSPFGCLTGSDERFS